MAGAESEDSLVSVFESMETNDEIKERSLRIDSLYTPGTINLPRGITLVSLR